MKTKKFLLATSGATVDGRTIDADWLRQMAEDYDPKTYGARLNIEHVRGISGQAPFRAYGDVLELAVEEGYEVKIGGATEKRTALFGTFDVTEDAKKLNDESQKVYPSIEVDPNFAGKGRAYMMGCALTDSPAAIGTDRLSFNRFAPGNSTVSENDLGAVIEFPDPEPAADAAAQEVKGFFSKLTELISGAAPAATPAVTPPASAAAASPQFDPATFAKELGDTLTSAFDKQAKVSASAIDELTGKFTALEAKIESTANPNHHSRPPATGGGGQHVRAEF